MREVPCMVCNKFVLNEDETIIAEVCDDCNGKDLDKFIKSTDYEDYKKIIEKSKKRIRITDNGELI